MQKKLLMVLTLIFSIYLNAQESQESVVLFELFTSQGCSSCPSADKLLDKIKHEYKDQNVFVLSYHVDYWNRLGWKDPFSKQEFSGYQREYGKKFGSRSIYTPQLVANGSEHFTGSNHYRTDTALQKYAKSKVSNTIQLENINRAGETIQLDYTIQGDKFNTITLALIVNERITKISRGENRDRTLKNTNIVANRVVLTNKAGEISIKIPDWVLDTDKLSIIGYTQDVFLKITGATRIGL